MKLSPLDDLTTSLGMDKARNHLIEKIMHITLDILYLLTGEDYVVLKMSGGRVTHSTSPVVSGGFCRNPSSNQAPQVDPMREERKNDEKILELTNTIAQLLTGEIPIRCQDVTVYFSMEECDNLEKSNAPTKEVPSEEQKRAASPDGSKNKELLKNFTPAKSEDDRVLQCDVLGKMIPRSTSGTQTLAVKQEETFEMVDEEAIPEHSSDTTGTTPEKHHCPPSPEDSSEDDGNILQDEQWEDFDDLKIETKSLEGAEEINKWYNVQEEGIPKKWKRGRFHKKSFTEEIKKPYQQQNEKERSLEGRQDLPQRTKSLRSAVIEIEDEEIGSLQRTAEWEIHEDGSTHLMTSGGSPNPTLKYSLASRITPDPKTAHPAVNAYPCPECGKCFSDVLHLESHQKVHSIPALFACAECGKSFTTSLELGTHIKFHTEQKLFACSECGKCFTLKSNLLAHKAIHLGEKPFVCAECGRRFATKSYLDTHVSVHALEKPYACSICRKCFTSKARLSFHQTTHIGEKSYGCEECGKVFTASGSLNRHKRTHTGEKPFACQICGKCFNRETNLYRHQMIHTR